MAFDCYVKIAGIEGECTAVNHENWIQVLSYRHAVTMPVSGVSDAGAPAAGRCEHADFAITKQLDKASPLLNLACSDGRHIDDVTVELCVASKDKKPCMKYVMTDVIVTGVGLGGSDGDEGRPVEEVTFCYGKIEWTYTVMDHKSFDSKGDVVSYYDVGTHKGG